MELYGNQFPLSIVALLVHCTSVFKSAILTGNSLRYLNAS